MTWLTNFVLSFVAYLASAWYLTWQLQSTQIVAAQIAEVNKLILLSADPRKRTYVAHALGNLGQYGLPFLAALANEEYPKLQPGSAASTPVFSETDTYRAVATALTKAVPAGDIAKHIESLLAAPAPAEEVVPLLRVYSGRVSDEAFPVPGIVRTVVDNFRARCAGRFYEQNSQLCDEAFLLLVTASSFEDQIAGNTFAMHTMSHLNASNRPWREIQINAGKPVSGDDRSSCASDSFVDLSNTDLSLATIRGASFCGPTLSWANMRGALLSGVHFSGTTPYDVQRFASYHPVFTNARLDGCFFDSLRLEEALFDGDSSTERAMIHKTVFRDLLMVYGMFNYSLLADNTKFERVSMQRAMFQSATLRDVTFEDSDLTGVTFKDASLERVQFRFRDSALAKQFCDTVNLDTARTVDEKTKLSHQDVCGNQRKG